MRAYIYGGVTKDGEPTSDLRVDMPANLAWTTSFDCVILYYASISLDTIFYGSIVNSLFFPSVHGFQNSVYRRSTHVRLILFSSMMEQDVDK